MEMREEWMRGDVNGKIRREGGEEEMEEWEWIGDIRRNWEGNELRRKG